MNVSSVSVQAVPIKQNTKQANPSFGIRNPLKYPGSFLDRPKNMKLTGNWLVDTVRKAPNTLAMWAAAASLVIGTGSATTVFMVKNAAQRTARAAQEKVRLEKLVKEANPLQIVDEAIKKLKGRADVEVETNKWVMLKNPRDFVHVGEVHGIFGLPSGALTRSGNNMDKAVKYTANEDFWLQNRKKLYPDVFCHGIEYPWDYSLNPKAETKILWSEIGKNRQNLDLFYTHNTFNISGGSFYDL